MYIPFTVGEIIKLQANNIHETLNIKLDSHNILQVQSLLHPEVKNICAAQEVNEDLFDSPITDSIAETDDAVSKAFSGKELIEFSY